MSEEQAIFEQCSLFRETWKTLWTRKGVEQNRWMENAVPSAAPIRVPKSAL